MITTYSLGRILPGCKDTATWARALNTAHAKYGITDRRDVAMFLAQTGHESAHLNVLQENLNYSAEALQRVFKRYFPTPAIAAQYARKPQQIASRVYANRMQNGNESSGDGWRYRGRGILQITGKHNYGACSAFLFDGDNEVLLKDPDALLRPDLAVESACWFWQANRLAGVHDVLRATRVVNGGTNGLDDRTNIYARALREL